MKRGITAVMLVGLLPLVGCSNYSAQNYAPSAQHVSQLRGDEDSSKVNLTEFESGEDVMKQSLCRMAGEVKPPSNKDWAGYVHDALKSELLMAERYAQSKGDAETVISGTLEKATFDSGSGVWDLALRLEFADGTKIREEVQYSFDSSFIATDACDGVADAFSPAVRELVGKILTNPTFREKLNI